ncbi:MAG: GtrA family protein [Sphingorhabdus sp.]
MNQGLFHQMMRYCLVGGVVYFCDFMVFASMMWLFPGAYLLANILGRTSGALLGFILHRSYTFSWEHKHKASRQALAYLLLFLGNLGGSSALLWLLVDVGHANAFVAKLLVDALIIAMSFVAGRLWVYRPA